MRAARYLTVLWPLLAALWASVSVLLGIGASDWLIVGTAGVGVVGGLVGAWFALLIIRSRRW